MATLKDFRDERLRKLSELQEMGLNPYPASSNRSNDISSITSQFDDFNGKTVTVVGRIMGIRKFGKLAFIVLRDYFGQIQLFIKADIISSFDAESGQLGIAELPLLDTGDFIEATGKVIKSKTGEISVETINLRLLTKALRPLPTIIEGFTNKEERLRRRYVDMNVNIDVRERFFEQE